MFCASSSSFFSFATKKEIAIHVGVAISDGEIKEYVAFSISRKNSDYAMWMETCGEHFSFRVTDISQVKADAFCKIPDRFGLLGLILII